MKNINTLTHYITSNFPFVIYSIPKIPISKGYKYKYIETNTCCYFYVIENESPIIDRQRLTKLD